VAPVHRLAPEGRHLGVGSAGDTRVEHQYESGLDPSSSAVTSDASVLEIMVSS